MHHPHALGNPMPGGSTRPAPSTPSWRGVLFAASEGVSRYGAAGGSMRRALVIAMAFAPSIALVDFTGRVVKVADGDTITVLVAKKQIKVRLDGIDAPERKQA